jgi:hypothetical protein
VIQLLNVEQKTGQLVHHAQTVVVTDVLLRVRNQEIRHKLVP